MYIHISLLKELCLDIQPYAVIQ